MKEGLFFFLYIFKDTSHTEKGVVNKYDGVLGLALLAEVLDDSKRRKRGGENKKNKKEEKQRDDDGLSYVGDNASSLLWRKRD